MVTVVVSISGEAGYSCPDRENTPVVLKRCGAGVLVIIVIILTKKDDYIIILQL